MQFAQAPERECAEAQPEIAQGDVVVSPEQKQVEYDACKPSSNDIRTEPWPKCDYHCGDHFDYPNDEHRTVRTEWRRAGEYWRHVLFPMRQETEELVQTGEKRCGYEPPVQDLKSLVARIVSQTTRAC